MLEKNIWMIKIHFLNNIFFQSDVRCGDCGWPVCGEECQKGHAHQIECPVLAKSKEKVYAHQIEYPVLAKSKEKVSAH